MVLGSYYSGFGSCVGSGFMVIWPDFMFVGLCFVVLGSCVRVVGPVSEF